MNGKQSRAEAAEGESWNRTEAWMLARTESEIFYYFLFFFFRATVVLAPIPQTFVTVEVFVVAWPGYRHFG